MKAFIVIVLVLCTFVDLTPFIFDFKLIKDQNAPLFDLLQTKESLVCLVVTFATCIPLCFDVLCYFLHRDSFFFIERCLLMFGCAFPLIVMRNLSGENAADVYLCASSIQSLCILAAMASGLSKSQYRQFSTRNVNIFYFLGCVSQSLMPFAELKHTAAGFVCLVTYNIFFGLAALWLLILFVWYIKDVWWSHFFKSPANSADLIATSEYLPLICSSVVVFYVFAYCIMLVACNITYMQDMTQFAFDFMTVFASFVAMTTTMLPGRIARSQVREVESNLEVKKSFVRYIGHEMRTPLNIASIGLDLLTSLDFLAFAEEVVNNNKDVCESQECRDISKKDLWQLQQPPHGDNNNNLDDRDEIEEGTYAMFEQGKALGAIAQSTKTTSVSGRTHMYFHASVAGGNSSVKSPHTPHHTRGGGGAGTGGTGTHTLASQQTTAHTSTNSLAPAAGGAGGGGFSPTGGAHKQLQKTQAQQLIGEIANSNNNSSVQSSASTSGQQQQQPMSKKYPPAAGDLHVTDFDHHQEYQDQEPDRYDEQEEEERARGNRGRTQSQSRTHLVRYEDDNDANDDGSRSHTTKGVPAAGPIGNIRNSRKLNIIPPSQLQQGDNINELTRNRSKSINRSTSNETYNHNMHSNASARTPHKLQQQHTFQQQQQRSVVQDMDQIVSEIRNAINQGTKILNDLLAYEKLDSNSMMLEKTYINIEELATNSLNLFLSQATAKDIAFSVDVESDLPPLRGDPYKIKQILANITSNALKFTHNGGQVDISLRRYEMNPDYLVIECKDNGIGMDRQQQRQLFSRNIHFDAMTGAAGGAGVGGGGGAVTHTHIPLTTLKSESADGPLSPSINNTKTLTQQTQQKTSPTSTGLGLYITKGLVELHGGTITVFSDGPLEGTTFTIKIPLDTPKNPFRHPLHHFLWAADINTHMFDPLVECGYWCLHRLKLRRRKAVPRVRVVSSEVSESMVLNSDNESSVSVSINRQIGVRRGSGSNSHSGSRLFNNNSNSNDDHNTNNNGYYIYEPVAVSGTTLTGTTGTRTHTQAHDIETGSGGGGMGEELLLDSCIPREGAHSVKPKATHNGFKQPSNVPYSVLLQDAPVEDNVHMNTHMHERDEATDTRMERLHSFHSDTVDSVDVQPTDRSPQTRTKTHNYTKTTTQTQTHTNTSPFQLDDHHNNAATNATTVVTNAFNFFGGAGGSSHNNSQQSSGHHNHHNNGSANNSSKHLLSHHSHNSHNSHNSHHKENKENKADNSSVISNSVHSNSNASAAAAGSTNSNKPSPSQSQQQPQALFTRTQQAKSNNSDSVPSPNSSAHGAAAAAVGALLGLSSKPAITSGGGEKRHSPSQSQHLSNGSAHTPPPSHNVLSNLHLINQQQQQQQQQHQQQQMTTNPTHAPPAHGHNHTPLGAISMKRVRQSGAKAVIVNSPQWLQGFHVLLVDDVASNLKIVTMLMKRLGCRCTTATNGQEAVDYIISKGVDSLDFVLMDNYMPILDGAGACVQMRAMGFVRPIIGLTGHALGEDLQAFKDAGANAVLTKPLDCNELKSILSLLVRTTTAAAAVTA